jgi:hypothetical protein
MPTYATSTTATHPWRSLWPHHQKAQEGKSRFGIHDHEGQEGQSVHEEEQLAGASMTTYDPNILQKFADRLYERATFVTFHCAVVGFLIGAGLGAIPANIFYNQELEARTKTVEEHYRGTGNGFNLPPMPPSSGTSPFALCIVGGVLSGVVGGFVGQRKGFRYRLQAQLTLCQMQIEHNSHRD